MARLFLLILGCCAGVVLGDSASDSPMPEKGAEDMVENAPEVLNNPNIFDILLSNDLQKILTADPKSLVDDFAKLANHSYLSKKYQKDLAEKAGAVMSKLRGEKNEKDVSLIVPQSFDQLADIVGGYIEKVSSFPEYLPEFESPEFLPYLEKVLIGKTDPFFERKSSEEPLNDVKVEAEQS